MQPGVVARADNHERGPANMHCHKSDREHETPIAERRRKATAKISMAGGASANGVVRVRPARPSTNPAPASADQEPLRAARASASSSSGTSGISRFSESSSPAVGAKPVWR